MEETLPFLLLHDIPETSAPQLANLWTKRNPEFLQFRNMFWRLDSVYPQLLAELSEHLPPETEGTSRVIKCFQGNQRLDESLIVGMLPDMVTILCTEECVSENSEKCVADYLDLEYYDPERTDLMMYAEEVQRRFEAEHYRGIHDYDSDEGYSEYGSDW